ncbi:MAG TPA: hypothetical protein V6D11_26520 [Waterburya sp.]
MLNLYTLSSPENPQPFVFHNAARYGTITALACALVDWLHWSHASLPMLFIRLWHHFCDLGRE